jgi:hypothetical protein
MVFSTAILIGGARRWNGPISGSVTTPPPSERLESPLCTRNTVHITQPQSLRRALTSRSGWLTDEARLSNLGTVSNITRIEAVGGWQDIGVEEKLAGDNFWQFGYSGYSTGRNHNDGFTIYLDE